MDLDGLKRLNDTHGHLFGAPEDGRELVALFKRADAAMYRAKSAGRSRVEG